LLEGKNIAFEGQPMDSKNELLLAVKEARRNLEDGSYFRAAEMLGVLEGIAPFLDQETVIKMKCMGCDNFAHSSFPLSKDFWLVDNNEYCYAKRLSMKHLSILKIAGCMEYSNSVQAMLVNLANSILEEDLKPAFAERKLYNRNLFASYGVEFKVHQNPGNVCIEFGHKSNGNFVGSDIKLYLLKRLDPGFGPAASQKIAGTMKDRPIMVVGASQQTRRQLDIDYIPEWIAKKRKIDIVSL
jgi:hypothetical protein